MSITAMAADQLAFPGAQGFGRYAMGARKSSTPTVYHVTNLNDSGTGSLRDAVSQSNRIVVFDVAGIINISSRIVFSSNLYVAGQTAPGEGITVYGDGVSFSGASNIICRYLRVRMGHNGSAGKDCAGAANGQNMMIDHCSFAWGLDETLSFNASGTLNNITISNCLIGQGLMTHSAGGLIQTDNVTLYRNLYCDNSTRNNKVKGIHQYCNNIVYNWKNGAYIMGGDSEGSSYANTENNLFINGPAGGGSGCTSANSDFHIYVGSGNWQDADRDGTLNPHVMAQSEYTGGPTFMSSAYDYPELTLLTTPDALATSVLEDAGASLPYRDYADSYMVNEVRSYGTRGVLISTEESLPFGNPNKWSIYTGTRPTDSDNDGMPDAWEDANGLNKSDASDATTKASNGYLNIENYINSISRDNIDLYLRQPMLLTLASSEKTALSIEWSDFTQGEDGFEIQVKNGSSWTTAGTTGADTGEYTITGLMSGTAYTVRVRAYKGSSYSDYSTEATFKTQPEEAEVVDIDSYSADLTWSGGDNDWSSDNWLEGVYSDGSNLLFDNSSASTVTLEGTVKPQTIVVRGSGNTTFSGSGIIAGSTSLNKGGSGTLTLNTGNTYTGMTAIHGGTVAFSSLANGGKASSIGASEEYAQNWLWDGGTWLYTGSSASSNREASLLSSTTLNIQQSGTVLSLSGAFSGAGSLTIDGSGTLQPTNKQFFGYSGDTRLAGNAVLQLKNVSTLYSDKICNLGGSTLILDGGGFKTTDANDSYATYNFPVNVETSGYINVHRNCSIANTVRGKGELELQLNYVREFICGDWSQFTGTVTANGVGTAKDGSWLVYLKPAYALRTGRTVLDGNTHVVCWGSDSSEGWLCHIGALAGGNANTYLAGFSKDNGSGTWAIGGLGTDETFDGVIANGGSGGTTSLIKEGAGEWKVTRASTYTGSTTVNEGTLTFTGKKNGGGSITVNSGATLRGYNTTIAGNITVNNGGTLYSGDGSLPGEKALTLTGNVSIKNGGKMVAPLRRVSGGERSYRYAMSGSTLTLATGSTLELEINGTPLEGDTYTIFSAMPTVSGTFSTISPATPGDGLKWDTSDLYTKGVIYVIDENAEPGTGGGDDGGDTPSTYTDYIVYSWTSPSGTPEEKGGKAVYENGDSSDRVNYANTSGSTTYYTLSLNGKASEMSGSGAAANGYIEISLEEKIATGDSIYVTAYRNKDTDAKANIYFQYSTGATVDDADNLYANVALGEEPSTIGYLVPSNASGASWLRLTRGTNVGTNLFITKLMIVRPANYNPTTAIRSIDASASAATAYTLQGVAVSTPQPGTIYLRAGKKYIAR